MAAFTGKAAGNWTAGGQTTWNEDYGGGHDTPVAGDTADLNGQIIVLDAATIPVGGGNLTSLTSTGAGQLTVAPAALGAVTINATTITAGTKNTGLIYATGTTANTITVNGNITGGSTTAGASGVRNQTTASPLTVVGNVTGGTATSGWGIIHYATGTVTITGDITGGSGGATSFGLYAFGNTTYNITGDVSGGTGGTAYGIDGHLGTVNITGDVSGGAGAGASGVWCETNCSVTLTSCDLINGTGGVAYSGKTPTWNPAATNYHQYSAGKLALEVAAASLIEGVTNGTVVGTYHEATVAEVQDGVFFGPGSAYEGEFVGGGGGGGATKLIGGVLAHG